MTGVLQTALSAEGLDLCVATTHGGHAACLVGNTRALWAPFCAWLRASPGRAELPHPLDTYVTEALARALAAAAVAPKAIHTPWESGAPDFIGLSVAAGLLWKAPCGLGIHAVHGPWVALRALIVLDVPGDEAVPATPAPACPHCAEGCGPRAQAMRSPATEAEFRARWSEWAALRRACPTGGTSVYGDDQLRYHYTRDRDLLRRLAGV